MLENGSNVIDLVLTLLDHCWGLPGWLDALKSVPVLDFGHFRHAPKLPISSKMAIFKHVGNGQSLTLKLISVHQTIMGDPNNPSKRVKTKSITFEPFSDMICTI